MSERTYFSLRYAVLGYTFILLILGINYVPLWKILSNTGVQADIFLVFLSLLSGSAFGFLISQIWWWWFRLKGAEYWIDPKATKILIEKYGLTKSKCQQDKKKVIIVHDYVTHQIRECRKGHFLYLERRWDVLHLLASVCLALGMGLVVGIVFRAISMKVFPWENTESMALPIISVLAIFWLVITYRGARWAKFQHDNFGAAVINSSELKPTCLGKIFSPLYFDFGIGEKDGAKLEDAGVFTVDQFAKMNPEDLSDKTKLSKEIISKWINQAKKFMHSSE